MSQKRHEKREKFVIASMWDDFVRSNGIQVRKDNFKENMKMAEEPEIVAAFREYIKKAADFQSDEEMADYLGIHDDVELFNYLQLELTLRNDPELLKSLEEEPDPRVKKEIEEASKKKGRNTKVKRHAL